MNDHIDVENAIGFKVLDLKAEDSAVGNGNAGHWVVAQVSLQSLRANLMHDRHLDAHV